MGLSVFWHFGGSCGALAEGGGLGAGKRRGCEGPARPPPSCSPPCRADSQRCCRLLCPRAARKSPRNVRVARLRSATARRGADLPARETFFALPGKSLHDFFADGSSKRLWNSSFFCSCGGGGWRPLPSLGLVVSPARAVSPPPLAIKRAPSLGASCFGVF